MSNIETLQPDRLEQQVRAGNSPLIKPILPEVVRDLPNEDRTEELVDLMLNKVFERLAVQEKEAFWSNALNEYNNFPKQTSRERKHAKNLVTQAASELLENPQYINIAEAAWKRHGAGQNHTEESKDSFPNLVKRECLALIKDKWQGVKPEQLAGLVRIYANKDVSQESARQSAKDLLTNYFKGPDSRNQRIEVYYNFVSGVLDLAEEDDAFREGMKIALHATDILPKDHSLVEQAVLVSLPYKEEGVFQKAIIANYIIYQLRFMGLQDITRYYDDRNAFVNKSIAVKQEMRKKEHRVTKEIGLDGTRKLNRATESFFYALTAPLSEERKQELMGTWPFDVVFGDPLNQKFNRILAENRSKSM